MSCFGVDIRIVDIFGGFINGFSQLNHREHFSPLERLMKIASNTQKWTSKFDISIKSLITRLT